MGLVMATGVVLALLVVMRKALERPRSPRRAAPDAVGVDEATITEVLAARSGERGWDIKDVGRAVAHRLAADPAP